MTKWADRAIEEAKKRKFEPKHQTSNVSAPIRGANQDQSGYGVSRSVADYTISDETIHEVVAGVGAIRVTPVTMQSTPRGRKATNAPSSAAKLQRAADKRRQQLDTFAQQQKDRSKDQRERLQKQREASRRQRQQNEGYEVKNHPVYGKVLAKDGETVSADYNTADAHAEKHKGSLVKTMNHKKFIVKVPEHMPVGPIKEEEMTSKIERFAAFIAEQEKRGRGRPKKATTDTGEPAAETRHSLVAQFRDRKPDASGHYSVDVDGKSHKVHTSHAQRFLSAHGAARTADQKDNVEKKFKAEIQGKK